MKSAYKFFNFILSFETYEILKEISTKNDISIANLVRWGIDLFLSDTEKNLLEIKEKAWFQK